MFGFFTRRKKKAAENVEAPVDSPEIPVEVPAEAEAEATTEPAAAPPIEAPVVASVGAPAGGPGGTPVDAPADALGDKPAEAPVNAPVATTDTVTATTTAPEATQAAPGAQQAAPEVLQAAPEAPARAPGDEDGTGGGGDRTTTEAPGEFVPTVADVLMGRVSGYTLPPPPPTPEPAPSPPGPASPPASIPSPPVQESPPPTTQEPELVLEPEPEPEPPSETPGETQKEALRPAEAAAIAAGAASPARGGWFRRLRDGLARSRGNLTQLFVGSRVDEQLFEDIETALIASDAGVATTEHLVKQLRERVRKDRIADAQGMKQALKASLVELLTPLEQPVDLDRSRPLVMMIAGVNGAGKTTSIGKLARHLRAIDQTVLLAAGDTFRAAAREQLARWGERNDVQVIASEGGDPAAVAFDAVKAGIARQTDVVIIDTAGRLPTQTHLMEELKKIRRVLGKAHEGAPHEVLLVLDGNTGQNMLAQVKAFDEAVQLTGLIVTKLDGTAKGGAIAALAHTRRDRPIPVYFIGVGEGVSDLEAFSAREFASALVD